MWNFPYCQDRQYLRHSLQRIAQTDPAIIDKSRLSSKEQTEVSRIRDLNLDKEEVVSPPEVVYLQLHSREVGTEIG